MATVDSTGDTSTADEDHSLWQKLKKMFGSSVTNQRKATNKYGNSGRDQTQKGGAYADASDELDKEGF